MSFISMGDVDLLHPPKELEQRRHKLKRVVQSPNSFFVVTPCTIHATMVPLDPYIAHKLRQN